MLFEEEEGCGGGMVTLGGGSHSTLIACNLEIQLLMVDLINNHFFMATYLSSSVMMFMLLRYALTLRTICASSNIRFGFGIPDAFFRIRFLL